MSKCYVHSDRKHLATGYIDDVRRKWMTIRIMVEDEDCYAECKKESVVKNQQLSIQKGRYIAISNARKPKIHICTCRWTKEEIAEAQRRGAELAAMLTEISEYKEVAP